MTSPCNKLKQRGKLVGLVQTAIKCHSITQLNYYSIIYIAQIKSILAIYI